MKKIMVIAILAMALLFSVVGCQQASVESIALTKEPKKVYRLNEEFNPANGEITATIKNSKNEKDRIVPLSDENVSITGFDSSKIVNSQEVTITYEKQSTTIKVDIVEVTAIEVSTDPKTVYFLNDTFSAAQGKLKVYLSNESTQTVNISDADVTVEGFDSTTTGLKKEITIKYGGKSTTLNIKVSDQTIKSIAVTKNPTKNDYLAGVNDVLLPAGGEITVTKTDDTTKTVALNDPDVKLTYNFSVRGLDNVNKKVTVEYGGHETSFNVVLTAEIKGISVKNQPKKDYIVNEPFYRGIGSIWLLYADNQNEELPLTDTAIGYDAGFKTNAAASISVKFTYGEFQTEAIAMTVIDGGKASQVMAKYVELMDVIIDWENGETDMTDEQIANAISMYTLYTAQDTNKTYLSSYQGRILSLTLAAKFMELYSTAMGINNCKLNEITYEEALALKTPLGDYIIDADAVTPELTAFNVYDTTILDESKITVYTVLKQISDAKVSADVLGENIKLVEPYYSGYLNIPNKVIAGEEVLQYATGIQSAYNKIMEMSSKKSEIEYVLSVLTNWRSDYLEIMYEYFYIANGRSFEAVNVEGSVNALFDVCQPQYFIDMTDYVVLYINVAISAVQEDLFLPMFIYYYQFRDRVEALYGLGYEGVIAIFEDLELFVDSGISYSSIYYDMVSWDHYLSYLLSGSFYTATPEVKAFLDVYLPVMQKLVLVFLKLDTTYLPGTVEYTRDAILVREEFFKLSTVSRLDIMYFFDSGFFYAFLQGYLTTVLPTDQERALYSYYNSLEISYFNFMISGGSSEQFYVLIDAFIVMNDAYIALPNKANVNYYMVNEIAFCISLSEWIAYMLEQYEMSDELATVSVYLKEALKYLSSTTEPREKFAAIVLNLVPIVEGFTEQDLLIFENLSVSLYVDGKTMKQYYTELLAAVGSVFPAYKSEDPAVKALFLDYMNILFTTIDDLGYKTSSRFTQDVEDLMTDFFALDSDSAWLFLREGQDLSWNFIVNGLFIPYVNSFLTEDNAKAAYVKLYDAVLYYYFYEFGYVGIDDVFKALDDYQKAYDDITNKNTFNTIAAGDIAYLQSLVTFLTDDMSEDALGSNLYKAIYYLTQARAAYTSYGNVALLTVYTIYAEELLTAEEMSVLESVAMFFENGVTLLDYVKELNIMKNGYMLINSSDDPIITELYDMLLESLFMFYTDESITRYKDKTGAERFIIDWTNTRWSTLAQDMFDLFMSMSARQQGVFYPIQQGADKANSTGYDYYRMFVMDYFSYLVDPTNYLDQEADNSDAVNAVGEFTKAITFYGLYQYGALGVDKFKEAFGNTLGLRDKLKGATLTTFNGIFDVYMTDYNQLYELFMSTSDNSLLAAIETMIKTIEAVKIMNDLGDATYFVVYYKQLTFAILNLSDTNRPYFNGRTYGHLEGSSTAKRFSIWLEEIEELYNSIMFDGDGTTRLIAGVDLFYRQFIYVANKFIEVGTGIDLFLFTEAYYNGNPDADVAMLIASFNQLDDAQRAAFMAIGGHVFRTMLRYYYGDLLAINDFFLWYDLHMAELECYNDNTEAFVTMMEDIIARYEDGVSANFEGLLKEEYERFKAIYDNLTDATESEAA